MATSQWVGDVTEETFLEEVVEQSRVRPIVVDFWAPWCGPCRALSPLLEKLAEESNGGFFLAKINTDDNPNVAGEFGVQGIPAVFAVRDGQVVNEFVGLLPESQLREFLRQIMPSQSSNDPLSDAEKLETANPAKSAELYRAQLSTDPKSQAARVGLARVYLQTPGRESEIENLLRDIDDDSLVPESQRLGRILRLRQHPGGDADLAAAQAKVAAEPKNAASFLGLGRVLASRGEYIPALDALLTGAEKNRELGRTEIRELMVEIFYILGVRSPDSDAYRSKLQSILY